MRCTILKPPWVERLDRLVDHDASGHSDEMSLVVGRLPGARA